MHKLICCFWAIGLSLILASCDKKPDVVYLPPVLTGTAYVLAANANHIAVVDLQSQDLDRIVIAKKGVDLASVHTGDRNGISILSEDGYLAFLPGAKVGDAEGSELRSSSDETEEVQVTKLNWKKYLTEGVALAAGENGDLWLLGAKEVVHLLKDGTELSRHPLSNHFSSIVFDAEHNRIWLLSRERAMAVLLDATNYDTGRTIEHLGNAVHQGLIFPGKPELWIAEGNEYKDGLPYGVGFAKKGPAMAGGFNIFSSDTGEQLDFVMVGGNVVDLVLGPKKEKVYAAVNRLPYYSEATLSVLGSESKRTQAQLRLCLACHEIQGVEIKGGQAEVRAIALLWSEEPGGVDEQAKR